MPYADLIQYRKKIGERPGKNRTRIKKVSVSATNDYDPAFIQQLITAVQQGPVKVTTQPSFLYSGRQYQALLIFMLLLTRMGSAVSTDLPSTDLSLAGVEPISPVEPQFMLCAQSYNRYVELPDIRQHLELGVNPNTQDKNGLTPLMHIIYAQDIQVIQLLLEKGADPNIADFQGETATYHAVNRGNVDILRLLLENNKYPADPNRLDKKFNKSPFHLAIGKGKAAMVELFLKHGASATGKAQTGFSPLEQAVFTENNCDVIEALLRYGASVHEKNRKDIPHLHRLAEFPKYIDNVACLIKHGVDFNKKVYMDNEFVSPLYLAVKHNNLPLAKLLLENGVDPREKCTILGHTPLQLAKSLGYHSIVNLFVDNTNKAKPKMVIKPVKEQTDSLSQFLDRYTRPPGFAAGNLIYDMFFNAGLLTVPGIMIIIGMIGYKSFKKNQEEKALQAAKKQERQFKHQQQAKRSKLREAKKQAKKTLLTPSERLLILTKKITNFEAEIHKKNDYSKLLSLYEMNTHLISSNAQKWFDATRPEFGPETHKTAREILHSLGALKNIIINESEFLLNIQERLIPLQKSIDVTNKEEIFLKKVETDFEEIKLQYNNFEFSITLRDAVKNIPDEYRRLEMKLDNCTMVEKVRLGEKISHKELSDKNAMPVYDFDDNMTLFPLHIKTPDSDTYSDSEETITEDGLSDEKVKINSDIGKIQDTESVIEQGKPVGVIVIHCNQKSLENIPVTPQQLVSVLVENIRCPRSRHEYLSAPEIIKRFYSVIGTIKNLRLYPENCDILTPIELENALQYNLMKWFVTLYEAKFNIDKYYAVSSDLPFESWRNDVVHGIHLLNRKNIEEFFDLLIAEMPMFSASITSEATYESVLAMLKTFPVQKFEESTLLKTVKSRKYYGLDDYANGILKNLQVFIQMSAKIEKIFALLIDKGATNYQMIITADVYKESLNMSLFMIGNNAYKIRNMFPAFWKNMAHFRNGVFFDAIIHHRNYNAHRAGKKGKKNFSYLMNACAHSRFLCLDSLLSTHIRTITHGYEQTLRNHATPFLKREVPSSHRNYTILKRN